MAAAAHEVPFLRDQRCHPKCGSLEVFYMVDISLTTRPLQGAHANSSLSLHSPHQRHRCPFRRSLPRAQYESTPISSTNISAHVLSYTFYAVNLSPASYDPAFGAGPDASVKAKIINLIASVRTIMRNYIPETNAIVVPLIFVNSVIILYELILG
ncbi:unnamed protein product [Fusarium equiseti]|uniref:Uncharacterized protein n=1 Tax=Fusarium equiseti TaxID=61235 RepID=A0A8J2IK96_FUSEQ|nr:unnamed protein product [Fusarium equiseti]